MDGLIIQLFVLAIFGAIAAAIANAKGRNVVGWFFGGFFLGLIGVIVVAVLPNLKEQEEYQRRMDQENRRLRERLRQEQVKNEAFRTHTVKRLDIHDRQIGIDTRSAGHAVASPQGQDQIQGPEEVDYEELIRSSSGKSASAGARKVPPLPTHRVWHFESQGQTRGPIKEVDLIKLFQSGKLNGSTLVWKEGMATWKAAREIGIFGRHFKHER